jgi:hypothetical protein
MEPFSCLALVFCVSLSPLAHAQQRGQPATGGSLDGKSAQGSLTVTAIVVSSVGIVVGPNGEQVLVVANAPAGDNTLTPVQTASLDPNGQSKNNKGCEKRLFGGSSTGRRASTPSRENRAR